MTVKLQDVLEVLRDFADTDPEQVDWEIIGDMVEQFLDDYEREVYFDRDDYLPEQDDFYGDKQWRERYGTDDEY